jgi:putative ABC transport system substrate-binding protein
MDRRRFLLTSLAGVLIAPLIAEAQSAGKVWRIGFLGEGPAVLDPGRPLLAHIARLRELGYVEGQNLVIEYRYAEGRPERLPGLAAELVALKVALIVTPGTQESLALKAATSTIPVVMLFAGDPVGAGLVDSLTRPGGNFTGTSLMMPDFGGKRLELLRELVPRLRRVTLLSNPRNASAVEDVRAIEGTAKSLGLVVHSIGVDSVDRLGEALARIANVRPDGVLVLQDSLTFARRRDIAEFALDKKLVCVFPGRAYVESGGLLGYGPDLRELAVRAASHVDRILKGAKPADLPVEQPTKFELVINLKTARALGLTIPPSLLARADHLIE